MKSSVKAYLDCFHSIQWASLVTQLVKNSPAMQENPVRWVSKIRWRRDRLPTPVFLGFPCGSVGKESACNVGDLGLIPGLGRSPGEGKGYPLQYSGLENSMNCIIHGVTKSQTWLSNFHFLFTQHIRINVRQSIDLNMKSEPIKLLEENTTSSWLLFEEIS